MLFLALSMSIVALFTHFYFNMELIIELVYWNWHFSGVIGISVCNWGGIKIAFSVVGTVVLELVFLSWNVLVIGVELKLDLI